MFSSSCKHGLKMIQKVRTCVFRLFFANIRVYQCQSLSLMVFTSLTGKNVLSHIATTGPCISDYLTLSHMLGASQLQSAVFYQSNCELVIWKFLSKLIFQTSAKLIGPNILSTISPSVLSSTRLEFLCFYR